MQLVRSVLPEVQTASYVEPATAAVMDRTKQNVQLVRTHLQVQLCVPTARKERSAEAEVTSARNVSPDITVTTTVVEKHHVAQARTHLLDRTRASPVPMAPSAKRVRAPVAPVRQVISATYFVMGRHRALLELIQTPEVTRAYRAVKVQRRASKSECCAVNPVTY